MTTGHTSRRAAWLGALLIAGAVGAGCSARGSSTSTGDVGSTDDSAIDASSPTDGGKSADVPAVPPPDAPSKDAGAPADDVPSPVDVPAPMDADARPDASGDLGTPTDAPACAPTALASAVGAGVARGTTVGRPNLLSTSRCGLPMGGTLGGNQAPEVVFRWTAPVAGSWVFDTAGSGFDTLLYVRTGSCTGAEIACNDDQSATVGPSRVAVSLTAGQEVLVVLDGFGTNAGDYVLNIGREADAGVADAGPPPDLGFDTCSSASLGSAVGAGVARGTTVGRTNRLTTTGCGIPTGGTRGGDPAPDVVFRWVAPSAGSWTFDTVGSDFDTLLYVRRGGCEGAEIACNDDQATTIGPSRVTVALTAGQEIFVVLDGFSSLSGSYVLNVNASAVGDAGAPGGPCAGETTEGRCDGISRVRYCSISTGTGEARLVVQDCAADERCEIGPTGRAACQLLAECRSGDTQCIDATHLRTCNASGRWVTSTCAPRCEDTGLAAACTLAVPVRTFAGTLTYAARPPNAGRTDWDTARTYPGAGFMVLSQRGASLIQSAVTDATGRFSIEVAQTATADDTLTFLALGRDPAAGGILYAVGDPALSAGEHDVAETSRSGAVPAAARVWSWRWNVSALTPTLHITTAAGSGAARVFDHVRSAATSTRTTFGRSGLRLLAWVGLNNRWDCGACFNASPVQGFGERFESQIWYAGGTDESYWSDSTSGHELGHWVMESYGQSPDEGGRHQIGVPTFPGQAWSEGFATFYGSDLRNDPVNANKRSGSMFWFDIATRTQAWDTWNLPSATAGLQQFLNETEVSAVLWSLRGASALPIYQALASDRMTRPPYGRCYNRHEFTLPEAGPPFTGVCEYLTIPAPHFADQLDAMNCTGFDRARLRAAIGAYPYPVDSPWCTAGMRPSTCAPRGDTPCR